MSASSVVLPEYVTYAYIALNVLNGVKMSFDPSSAALKFGYEARTGTFRYVLIEGCGFVALGSALTLALLASGLAPLVRAIPYGLLFRGLWLKKGLDGAFERAGMRPSVKVRAMATLVGPGSVVFLLLRSGPRAVEKAELVVTVALTIVSGMIVLAPDFAAPFLFSVQVSSKDKAVDKGVLRHFGLENLVSSVLMTFLLSGIEIQKALGYTSVVWFLQNLFAGYVVNMHRDLGVKQEKFLYQMMLSGLFAWASLSGRVTSN